MTRRPTLALALTGLGLASLLPAGPFRAAIPPATDPAAVVANDNRTPVGTLTDGVLTVRLEVRLARWYPEADDGPSVVVPAFAEVGGAARIPGPLIRVPEGTRIRATVTNALADSTIWLQGFVTRPAATLDSVPLAPGETRTLEFAAGAAGSYLYRARYGVPGENAERDQLAGALVVDAPGAAVNDRVFVINIWSRPVDTTISHSGYLEVLSINGKSWPYTERQQSTVGDSVHWRWINASGRDHPMHLHGFFYRIEAKGNALRDSTLAPEDRPLVVTESLQPDETMRLVWSPHHQGNWLFHCHLSYHVSPHIRLPWPEDAGHAGHGPAEHMAGLVLGLQVRLPPGETELPWRAARHLRLLVEEGPRRFRAEPTMGYALQGDDDPAPAPMRIPGPPLVLTQGEPTAITVVNHLAEPTGVHWHGLELESASDGVTGWSGIGDRRARPIAPGDSFTARLTLARPGTFIYHTHLNDLVQLTSGLYGAIVVLEPGQRFDPATDHLMILGWDGPFRRPLPVVLNGDTLPPPLELAAGLDHRLRLINIGPAGRLPFSLWRDSTAVVWQRWAKDGADLPASQRQIGTAPAFVDVGETADMMFHPLEPGRYELRVGRPNRPLVVQRLLVR